MKKTIMVLGIAVILVMAMGLSAGAMEFNGGITYNTYKGQFFDGNSPDSPPLVENGVGYFAEGIFWLGDQLGWGIELEMLTGTSTIYPITVSNITPYANLHLKAGVVNLFAGVGFNIISINEFDVPAMKGGGIGFQIGGNFDLPLTDTARIIGTVGYRYAKPRLLLYNTAAVHAGDWEPIPEEDYFFDMSGFSAGLALSVDL